MMMRVIRSCGGALVLAAVLAGSGCGGAKKLVKVEGKVTLDGAPLDGALVKLVPEGGNGQPANGITKTDGTFRLTTFVTGDGALPGDYQVTITKKMEEQRTDVGIQPSPGDTKMAREGYLKMFKAVEKNERAKKKSFVHPNYSDPKRSALKCRVPPDRPLIFELTSTGN